MRRIPARQKMRKELEELLKGVNKREFLLNELIKKGHLSRKTIFLTSAPYLVFCVQSFGQCQDLLLLLKYFYHAQALFLQCNT